MSFFPISNLIHAQQLEVEGDLQVNGRITGVMNPVNDQDAATKAYIDQMSEMMLDAGLNGVVSDIDNNVYKTIKIGTQVWMAENLKTTKYNDGTNIQNIVGEVAWGGLSTAAYCWYNDINSNSERFGALYNFHVVAATNSLNVCPEGWSIPSESDWLVLTNFLTNNGYGYEGSGSDIGKALASRFRWTSDGAAGNVGNDLGSNNSSGFSSLPAGYRVDDGGFDDDGIEGYFWSSTEDSGNATDGVFMLLSNYSANFTNSSENKNYGMSVRCLRD